MKEIYSVKCPRKIVFGDPWYFERYEGEQLDKLTVNLSPPQRFSARVVLEETPDEEMPELTFNHLSLYMAPEKHMDVYLQEMIYESQKCTTKQLGVDTARYYLRVDKQDDTIHTGGDGYWGFYQEITHNYKGNTVVDASILSICMPDDDTMDDVRERLNYFFKDVQLIERQQDQSEMNSMISPT